MRKATLQQYLQIGNMIESGAIDRTLAQAIIEGGVVMRSELKGEAEGIHPHRNASSDERDVKQEAIEYFIPLADADVPDQYQATLAKYRNLATNHDVPATTAVCYRVKAGFTLKWHAPLAGPCYENYKYLQDWDFPNEATADCLVFWVPRVIKIFKGRTSKTKDRQLKLLSDLRVKLALPAHHMSGFGKNGLLAGLILAHYEVTGERVPHNKYWVRTDTYNEDGRCLYLGRFDDAGLRCNNWGYDGDTSSSVGVFALGVETLEP